MDTCVVCGGQEFYLEAGYYFCKECQTQHQEKREEVVEFHIDSATRLRRTRVRKDRSGSGAEPVIGWTTWEQFNFVLIGLVNELIELGAPMDIKLTVVQLWATYLGKLEVAFTSMNKKTVPKLSRRHTKKDAEIIYGRMRQKKKKKRSKSVGSGVSASSVVSSLASGGSSRAELQKHKRQLVASEYERFIQSQNSDSDVQSTANQSLTSIGSNESEASMKGPAKIKFNKCAKEEKKKVAALVKAVPKLKRKKFKETYCSASYKCGPQVIKPSMLWGILYLALRIHDDKLHLSDMLRFGREGHLSYYRLEHLLPAEVTLSKAEISNLNQLKEISHKGMRKKITELAKLLGVVQIPHPNLLTLMERYVTELQLPNGILVYAERMMAKSPPIMNFNRNSKIIPNYEGRVMAFIIVVMKILFGLDGVTEYKISRVIERIHNVAEKRFELESRLFNFCEWQRYIECRRCTLIKEHFPTKLKRDPHSTGSSHLYVKFIESIKSKYEGDEPEMTKAPNLVPYDLSRMMKQSVERLSDNMPMAKDVIVFPPSLISQHAYLQQLLADPNKDLPSILQQNFPASQVGYMLKPESLEQLAAECGIELHVVAASAHFMEKIVQTFDPPTTPSIRQQKQTNNHNNLTRVFVPNTKKLPETTKLDDPSEYLHRKYPGTIVIDSKKQRLYNKIKKPKKHSQNNVSNDFEFNRVLPNGKLNIPRSDDESDDEDRGILNIEKDYNIILSNFERQTILHQVDNPWKKSKVVKHRRNGKFIKASEAINIDAINCDTQDSAPQSQIQEEIMLIDDDVHDADNDDNSDPIIVREILEHEPEMHDSDSDEISILTERIDPRQSSNIGNNSMTSKHETLTLFRPFKQFWLRRCQNYSHIQPSHFHQLERDFPPSFRWLLHECAFIIEMNVEELYEEVCLIENYYADVLFPKDGPDMSAKYDTSQYRLKAHLNAITKKWKD